MSDELKAAEARLENLQTRYDKLREENTAAQASIKGIAKERDAFKAQAAQSESLTETLTKLRGELDATQRRSAADLAMSNAGLKKASRQRFVRSEYAAHKEEAGDKAQDFGDWFEAQQKDEGSDVAEWLKPAAAAAAAPDAPAEPTRQEVRTEVAVLPTPAPPSPYTPGSIANMPKAEFMAMVAAEGVRRN